MEIAVSPQYSTCKPYANVQKSEIAKLFFHHMNCEAVIESLFTKYLTELILQKLVDSWRVGWGWRTTTILNNPLSSLWVDVVMVSASVF